ncbi:MAG: alanine racemase [Candidatus Thorarchaeota archaeon]
MKIEDLVTPALVVDIERLRANIENMAARSRNESVSLRPHVKTHKCAEIAKMQLERGARGITVSTMAEALAFADAGFDDITLAIPITNDKMETALDLSSRTSLKLLVDHPSTVDELSRRACRRRTEVEVLLKVDCGYHRCGVDPRDPASLKLANRIATSTGLHFGGILTHAGHAYLARSPEQVREIASSEQETMVEFSQRLYEQDINLGPTTVSIGSTPTIAQSEHILEGVTEVRPGNYVFFDRTQVMLGSCTLRECSLTVLTRVLGVYRDHIVVDAGATALSKDTGPIHIDPNCGYGLLVRDHNSLSPFEHVVVESLSQEHAKIRVPADSILNQMEPSSMLEIVPNHSCLAAAMFDWYHVLDGDRITDKWRVIRERFS